MNEAEYHRTASATLFEIERRVEASGADIDFENTGDVLTLEFADGSKLIVNKQAAAHQIWVAARSGGFHYAWDAAAGVWRNDQNRTELFSELARLVSDQAGKTVRL